MAGIRFEDIPESSFEEIKEGRYPFIVNKCTESTTTNGYKTLIMELECLCAPRFKINFENFIYGTKDKDFDFTNAAVRFGAQKLKKLNEATLKLESLDLKAFSKLIVGQKFEADIELNEKSNNRKYPQIKGTNIYTLEVPEVVSTSEKVLTKIDPLGQTRDVSFLEDEDPFAE